MFDVDHFCPQQNEVDDDHDGFATYTTFFTNCPSVSSIEWKLNVHNNIKNLPSLFASGFYASCSSHPSDKRRLQMVFELKKCPKACLYFINAINEYAANGWTAKVDDDGERQTMTSI